MRSSQGIEIGTAIGRSLTSTFNSTVSSTKWLFGQLKLSTFASAELKPTIPLSQRADEINLPAMAQPLASFEMGEQNNVKCFHTVFSVMKDSVKYFFKRNPPNSAMSELEAYCRASIDVIAHGFVPPAAIPVHDEEGQFVGLCSQAIPKFKAVIDAPFEEDDFTIPVLDNHLMSIEMLKKLDKWARLHKLNLHELSLEDSEWSQLEIKDDADEFAVLEHDKEAGSFHDISPIEVDNQKRAEKEKFIAQMKQHEAWFESKELASEQPAELKEFIKKIAKDLINFRYVMGFGINITSRYIHAEDDFHRGNIGRGEMQDGTVDIFGIDYDMAKWEILYAHKDSGLIDKITRNPSSKSSFFRSPIGRFIITAKDIRQLPHTEDATPFYGPTKGVPGLPEWAKGFLTSLLGGWSLEYLSNNAFREEDNKAFVTLIDNPVFIYYKFKTLLKYILTESALYEDIAKLYIRNEVSHEEMKMIDALKNHEAQRLKDFRAELFKMEEFKQFLRESGEDIKQEIKEEFAEINKEYGRELIDINKIESECSQLIAFADNVHVMSTFDASEMTSALTLPSSSKSTPLASLQLTKRASQEFDTNHRKEGNVVRKLTPLRPAKSALFQPTNTPIETKQQPSRISNLVI